MRAEILLLCLLAPVAAHGQGPAQSQAQSQARAAASQAAGLFVQSCVQHAGSARGVRDWAGGIGLPLLAEPGQAGFLRGAAGRVYDASNPAGKYVVVSLNDGGCLVMAEAVDPGALVQACEAALAEAGIAAVLDKREADPGGQPIQHRTYRADRAERAWSLVISHGEGSPDQAMLSAMPR